MTPFDGEFMTSYLMAIVMFALCLTMCEIFTKVIKCQQFYLEIEGQGEGEEKLDLHHSIRNARFYIGEFFFRILVICVNIPI